MSNSFKSSPNQKVIKVNKEKCDKQNYYAAINLNALESAAIQLKSGAFKMWVYFAKNQNDFEFALSNKAVAETFGVKKDQYDNAIKELIEKGYLVETSKNHFKFCEVQEKTTLNCEEKPQKEMAENHTRKEEKPISNNTKNTNDNTKQKTFVF